MIASLIVDEIRAKMDEDISRAQFKTPPVGAEERLERELSKVARSLGGTGRAMTVERARAIAADAALADRALVAGKMEDV